MRLMLGESSGRARGSRDAAEEMRVRLGDRVS